MRALLVALACSELLQCCAALVVTMGPKPPPPPSQPRPPPRLTGKAAKKAKLAAQRAGGSSSLRVTTAAPASQAVRVETARRGDKMVTMIKGLECGLDARKALLKECKSKCGGGGALDTASGVLEVQGAHAPAILALLLKKGYTGAKQSGRPA